MLLPEGACAIDERFVLDPCPITFGLGHTDSNQHVNSLVYPRLLEEAALRRFDALGLETRVLARFVDLAFRKPCFAGDRVRIALRADRVGDEVGVVAAFVPAAETTSADAAPNDRAHAFGRMQFTPWGAAGRVALRPANPSPARSTRPRSRRRTRASR